MILSISNDLHKSTKHRNRTRQVSKAFMRRFDPARLQTFLLAAASFRSWKKLKGNVGPRDDGWSAASSLPYEHKRSPIKRQIFPVAFFHGFAFFQLCLAEGFRFVHSGQPL